MVSNVSFTMWRVSATQSAAALARERAFVEKSDVIETAYSRFKGHISAESDLAGTVENRYPEILLGLCAPEAIKDRQKRQIAVRMRNKLLLQTSHGLEVNPDKIVAVMLRVWDSKMSGFP